jgi:hypothetical protein
MSDYLLIPVEAPSTPIVHAEFKARVTEHWDGASSGDDTTFPGDQPGSWVMIPRPTVRLTVTLNPEGDTVGMSPADPAAATEFVLWWLDAFGPFDVETRLYGKDFNDFIVLSRTTGAEEVRSLLGG